MMKQMTPRTDAARTECYCGFDQGGVYDAASRKDEWGDWVAYEVAEQLETELNETKAALEREQQDCAALRQMVRELRDALDGVMDELLLERHPLFNQYKEEANAALTKAKQLLP